MKKIVYSIFLLSLAFLMNVWLYYYSESYSFFLKKLKYWNEIISNDSKNITDDYIAWNTNTWKTCNCDEKTDKKQIIEEKKDYTKDIEKILNWFQTYSLVQKPYDEYYKLFDITDEYPDTYMTYSSKDLDLFMFPWAKYEDVFNLFDLLSTDINKNFLLNKVIYFWKKAFFINMKTDDGFARVVIDDWNILFWLKFKKSSYNDVKKIIEKF